jgi:hypothetical protein
MSNRTPRELETREKATRYVYKPSSALPEPTPEPGFKFRWIATTVFGQSNATNVSQKYRDGWVPVKAEDHPEMHIQANKDGNVEIGGLLLCKAPEEMTVARNEYYASASKQQMESVDNHFMRNNDARMPLFSERKSSVSRGTGFGNGSK